MRTRWMERGGALLAIVSAVTLSLPAAAQLSRGGITRSAQGIRRPALVNHLKELQALAESLAARYQSRIVVDPLLFVAAPPKAPAENAAIEAAMDFLVSQIKNADWRRVYLTQTQANMLPPAEKLAAAVRALDMVEQNGLVLENPRTQRATSFIKNMPLPQNFGEELTARQFSAEPIYVLYNKTGERVVQSLQDRMLDLQREQLEMMLQMSPEQMAEAMERGMQMWMNLDPQVRSQFMGTMIRVGMQTWGKIWNTMPPDQRQQFMQQMIQDAQQIFGTPGPRP